jgi:hypothetical protein
MTATGQVSAWEPTSSGHGGQEMGDHAWVDSERVLGVDACKPSGMWCVATLTGTLPQATRTDGGTRGPGEPLPVTLWPSTIGQLGCSGHPSPVSGMRALSVL